jgi:hypothetical protein
MRMCESGGRARARVRARACVRTRCNAPRCAPGQACLADHRKVLLRRHVDDEALLGCAPHGHKLYATYIYMVQPGGPRCCCEDNGPRAATITGHVARITGRVNAARCHNSRPRCNNSRSRCNKNRPRCDTDEPRCNNSRPRCNNHGPRCNSHRPRCNNNGPCVDGPLTEAGRRVRAIAERRARSSSAIAGPQNA